MVEIRIILLVLIAFISSACRAQNEAFLVVLGIAQDAGYPQASCHKDCCEAIKKGEANPKKVSSVGIVFPKDSSYIIFDMSPDFREQSRYLEETFNVNGPKAIFLSHAHIGHYTGLMYLGRESRASSNIPCYSMPRMRTFLENNGPWNQLVKLENISLEALEGNKVAIDGISIEALEVPHRDEYSETVGFYISSQSKKILFIPDIDKWDKWNQDITEWIEKCDYAFLDGTFYGASELKNRNMSEIPHPFITESVELFESLSAQNKEKINFIHLNHSNPLLWNQQAINQFKKTGFKLAYEGQLIKL